MSGRSEDPARLLAELAAVQEIGKVLTSTLEVQEVLRRIMGQVSELLCPRRWSMLLTEEDGSLSFEVAVGEGSDRLQGTRIGPGEGIAGWVASKGEPVLLDDARADERWSDRFDEATGFATERVLAVPMVARERILGVIELVGGPSDDPFTENDLRLLSSLADYAAIGLMNARNYDRVQALTIRDDHTGLFNARFLFRTLRLEVERARRYLHPVSLIFLDLDRFKEVNDTHGHLSGSALLKEVGQVIEEASRATDTVCRYGGDEFAVVLPETGRDGARNSAERILSAMREHVFLKERGMAVHLSASFGCATFPDDAKSSEGLLSAADHAMYAAKEAGRDRICRASRALLSEEPGETDAEDASGRSRAERA
ncbi:MAG: sensor domain-containing diguanylate cyclase [Deltaproteobacteria bacterium]|nr:sensor domain-containing diguanylate cyclase [Deltaproteobacteria bacterium]